MIRVDIKPRQDDRYAEHIGRQLIEAIGVAA